MNAITILLWITIHCLVMLEHMSLASSSVLPPNFSVTASFLFLLFFFLAVDHVKIFVILLTEL